MLHEYDVVKLKRALPDHGLSVGANGAVLIVHQADPPAYEVEFCDDNGKTLALLTLRDADLEFVRKG